MSARHYRSHVSFFSSLFERIHCNGLLKTVLYISCIGQSFMLVIYFKSHFRMHMQRGVTEVLVCIGACLFWHTFLLL